MALLTTTLIHEVVSLGNHTPCTHIPGPLFFCGHCYGLAFHLQLFGTAGVKVENNASMDYKPGISSADTYTEGLCWACASAPPWVCANFKCQLDEAVISL